MAKRLALLALLFLIPGMARADSVWDYTSQLLNGADYHGGNPGPNCNCFLTGTVVEDSSFNVISYSFTDGLSTLTNIPRPGSPSKPTEKFQLSWRYLETEVGETQDGTSPH